MREDVDAEGGGIARKFANGEGCARDALFAADGVGHGGVCRHELGENHFSLFLTEDAGAVGELELDGAGEAWGDGGMVATIEGKLHSIGDLVWPNVADGLKRRVANAPCGRILKRERGKQNDG